MTDFMVTLLGFLILNIANCLLLCHTKKRIITVFTERKQRTNSIKTGIIFYRVM